MVPNILEKLGEHDRVFDVEILDPANVYMKVAFHLFAPHNSFKMERKWKNSNGQMLPALILRRLDMALGENKDVLENLRYTPESSDCSSPSFVLERYLQTLNNNSEINVPTTVKIEDTEYIVALMTEDCELDSSYEDEPRDIIREPENGGFAENEEAQVQEHEAMEVDVIVESPIQAVREKELYCDLRVLENMKFMSRTEVDEFLNGPGKKWSSSDKFNFTRLHKYSKDDEGMILATCMANTYQRRRRILVNPITTETYIAIKYFPGLTDYKQIRLEFQRIKGKDVDQFEDEICKMLAKVMPHERNCPTQGGKALSYECMCIFACSVANNPDNYAQVKAFICEQTKGKWTKGLVTFAMPGQEDDVVTGMERMQPTIIVDQAAIPFENGASVYVDKVKVVSGLNFLQALLAAYYLYWVFNLDYNLDDKNVVNKFENILETVGEKLESQIVWDDEDNTELSDINNIF